MARRGRVKWEAGYWLTPEQRDNISGAVAAAQTEIERLERENEELTETIRQARNVQAGIFRLFPEVAAAVLAALDINEARALLPHSKGAMGDEP